MFTSLIISIIIQLHQKSLFNYYTYDINSYHNSIVYTSKTMILQYLLCIKINVTADNNSIADLKNDKYYILFYFCH